MSRLSALILMIVAAAFAYGSTIMAVKFNEMAAKIEVNKACSDYYATMLPKGVIK